MSLWEVERRDTHLSLVDVAVITAVHERDGLLATASCSGSAPFLETAQPVSFWSHGGMKPPWLQVAVSREVPGMDLSVKVNDVFGPDVPDDVMVRRSAAAGADAIGFWPWYADLDDLLTAIEDEGLELAYLSGGSQSLSGPEFPLTDPDRREETVAEIAAAIDVAAAVGSDFLNIIPGRRDETRDPAVHHRSIVAGLRAVAARAERAGLTLLVEPVNTRGDHPGIYLTSSFEGYKIVDAVDSPNVKLLYDVYHQQITEGNLISNLRTHIDTIGHIHVGDVPGRHEPGTGEINYENVFGGLAAAGYDGYIGCEYEPTVEPEETIRTVRSMIAAAES